MIEPVMSKTRTVLTLLYAPIYISVIYDALYRLLYFSLQHRVNMVFFSYFNSLHPCFPIWWFLSSFWFRLVLSYESIAETSLYSKIQFYFRKIHEMVGPGIFCRGISPAYIAGAYFGDMLQGQVSLFDQGELDQAKISRKRFYICFSLLTP